MRIYRAASVPQRTGMPVPEGGGVLIEAGGWQVQIKRLPRWRKSRYGVYWDARDWKSLHWRYSVAEGRCLWRWGPLLLKLPRVANREAISIPFGEENTTRLIRRKSEGEAPGEFYDTPPVPVFDRHSTAAGERLRQAVEKYLQPPP